MSAPVLTVSQLNLYVKQLLETDKNLVSVYLAGEISNFTNHYRSGHLYLSLKDENAVIRAVMFRSAASKLVFEPQNGMRVICRGRVSLYERDGQYQFYIDSMQPDGAGALAIAYEQLLARLRQEGLFDESRKKPIPRYPRSVAVITSPTGAAVRDILGILARRYKLAKIILCPVQVQGDSAAPGMIAALTEVQRKGCADVIIIGRGGGSIEELWAFNDERLARAVAACSIPVISAVGHETDFTICDFAADLRAPTPSAAAELAVPDSAELLLRIRMLRSGLFVHMKSILARERKHLRLLSSRPILQSPRSITDLAKERLDYLSRDLKNAFSVTVSRRRQRLAALASALDALSPLKVLGRGYSILCREDGTPAGARELRESTPMRLIFADAAVRFTPVRVEYEQHSGGSALTSAGKDDTP